MQPKASVVLSFVGLTVSSALFVVGCGAHNGTGPAAATSASPVTVDAGGPTNVLTAAETAAGWRLLFDGKTTAGWRGFKKPTFPEKGWRAEDGILKHEKNEEGFHAGDIVTDEQFDNFELTMDFKVTPRGNSGLKYLVSEEMGKPGTAVGFEYQILDDDLHPDAKKGKDGNRRCGGLYDLIAPPADKVLHPVGQWNQARLVVDGNNIEHWLNGKKTVSYVRGSAELKALIAESKFKDIPGFGENAKGHILLQDHNDEIGFRNIKVRTLPAK
jgi:hypothetical protein